MVDQGRNRFPELADRLSVGRAEELPFADEAFDVVVMIAVLEYTELDAAMRELVRVLRPRGRTVIGLRKPVPARRRPRRVPLGLEEAVELLRDAGLVVDRVEPAGARVVPAPVARLAPRLAARAGRLAERSRSLRRAFGTQRLILAHKSSR